MKIEMKTLPELLRKIDAYWRAANSIRKLGSKLPPDDSRAENKRSVYGNGVKHP